MSVDPTRMCELLAGLPDVAVLEVLDSDELVRVTVQTRRERPVMLICRVSAVERCWCGARSVGGAPADAERDRSPSVLRRSQLPGNV